MRRRPAFSALVVISALALAGCSSAGSGGSTPSESAPPSTASITTTPTATATATTSAAASSTTPSRSDSPRTAAPRLTHFRLADLTWIGSQGWALGSADCLGGKGTCDAIEHTGDGGKHWASMPAPRANIGVAISGSTCASPCVTGVRFATTEIGYAFGGYDGATDSQTLLMTSDGGRKWTRQSGGAIALEAANGTVIRITSASGGCPGPCRVGIETAPVGGTTWTHRALGGETPGYGVRFGRTGAHAYLLFLGHPAGGGNSARSTLYRSSDNGVTWHRGGEPCPQAGSREVDSLNLTSAPDGALALLCRERVRSDEQFAVTSTDGSATFRAGSRTALGSGFVTAIGAASARVLVVSADHDYRSVDGGAHFARLGANAGSSPGKLAWLGFASSSVGHGISADRHSIWTTADAGRSWSRYAFG